MVVDPSALVAIVLEESDAITHMAKLSQASSISLSAVTLAETSMVLLARGGSVKVRILNVYLAQLEAVVVPVDRAHSVLAFEAFDRYGKGRHRAGLNFGDCFTYALVKSSGEPLLYKGDDFGWTDVVSA